MMEDLPGILKLFRKAFFELVQKNFPGGINPSSIIDRKKFARLFPQYLRACCDENFADQATILSLARSECVPVGEKFYAIDDQAQEFLEQVFALLQADGVNTISFKRFFARYDQNLRQFGIASPEILASYIKNALSFPCDEFFFRLNPAESPDSEIQNRLSGLDYVPMGELPVLFPFMEEEQVVGLALKHGLFRRLKNKALFRASSLSFDEDEWSRELQKIQKNIRENGFSSLSGLDLAQSRDKYPDLPEEAFRFALEEKLDAANLHISGPSIIRHGGDVCLSQLIRQFCRRAEHFSFETLVGEFGPDVEKLRHLIWLLQEEAIQINQHNFINLKNNPFDVAATDEIIAELTQRQPISVLSISSFSLFPSLSDYAWNHYLLQSFCLHTSHEFGLARLAPNKSLIGIIYDNKLYKNLYKKKKDYYKLAAVCALRDKVIPDLQNLGSYLKKNGYLGTLRNDAVKEVLVFMTGHQKH